jgi:PAS domain S-box-containing protein
MTTYPGRGGGITEQSIAKCYWSSTATALMNQWTIQVRKKITSLMEIPVPMAVLLGQDNAFLYNEAYANFWGYRNSGVSSARALEEWSELIDIHGRILHSGLTGNAGSLLDESMTLNREGGQESIWLEFDYGPLRGEGGNPLGVFVFVRETTEWARLKFRHAGDLAQLEAARSRHRCLVELGDRLRRCDTAWQISGAVSEILGEVLNCARTGYATIDGPHTLIENDWTNGTIASLSGRHEFLSLGQGYVDKVRRGEILVAPDINSHAIIADSAPCWRAIGVAALLNVPLLDNGAPVGLLYAHESHTREWTHEEVALVKEVADRTWEAMGRARAVEALRQINASLEGQVRERTIQLDRMWMLSADLMMVTHRDGRIVSVNPAWTRVLGWRESELVGAFFYDFIHPDDLAPTRAERRKIESGQMVERFENRYLSKDGREIWLSWTAVPDGDIIHSVARDVSAEREQANALRAAEEALRHAQKMEAIGQLTGGIAHDFNNLLQGILGALELVGKRIDQGRLEDIAKYNALARSSAERASTLTHRLLAFSRRQPLSPKPVEPNVLILGMEPLLRRIAGEAIHLEFDLAPDLWPILCDPSQLDSSILNLAINARDAMPDGGALTVRSYNASKIGGPAGGLPEDKVCLAVCDTGAGMAADVVEHAFDPFYTTKPIGQGTGLGLSMVYGFMRQSDGLAEISSTLGVGTTVSLYFRRYAERMTAEETAAPPTGSVHERRGQGTVLVVEDELSVRCLIVEALQEVGFKVIEAGDGPSGLEILQSPEKIDLLLTDIGLPGLNGRQVAEAGRLRRPELKVLFMTGYADASLISDGFLMPGMEMMTKPFNIKDLEERVLRLNCAYEDARPR